MPITCTTTNLQIIWKISERQDYQTTPEKNRISKSSKDAAGLDVPRSLFAPGRTHKARRTQKAVRDYQAPEKICGDAKRRPESNPASNTCHRTPSQDISLCSNAKSGGGGEGAEDPPAPLSAGPCPGFFVHDMTWHDMLGSVKPCWDGGGGGGGKGGSEWKASVAERFKALTHSRTRLGVNSLLASPPVSWGF